MRQVMFALLVAGGLMAGCTPPATTPDPEAFIDVVVRNSAFVPKEVTIKRGQTIRWKNDEPVFHTVTSGNPEAADAGVLFDSNDMIPFETFTHQFNGEFVYHSKRDIAQSGPWSAPR